MDRFEEAVERLGQRIRQLRQGKGLNQQELAEKAGVFDVGELERGYKVKGGPANPRLETLHKVAMALGVTIEELFGNGALDVEALEIRKLLENRGEKTLSRVRDLLEVVERWEKK